ncbi:MAG TPA: glutathione peroxidase [Saprospirales bacterium]|nr:glutathione peroxidase [Saprospirales bacterium]
MYNNTLLFLTLAFCMAASSCFDANQVSSRPQESAAIVKTMQSSFYQLQANSLEGKPVSLDQFKGKKIIVLNVASKCGYTPQYADWERFFQSHKDQAVVLGFPSNNFMGQEPGSAEEIAEFCQKNYGVSFPMFEKVDVKGEGISPVYKWLTDPAQNGWNKQEPSWNFCKYLINEKGELTHFFASKVTPESPEFKEAFSK